MNVISDAFEFARQRAAYDEIMGLPISCVIDELKNEFSSKHFQGMTEVVLESNSPATKLTVSNHNNICSVYVVYDSMFSKYGVGVKGPMGLNNLTQANTPDQVKEIVKQKFTNLIVNW